MKWFIALTIISLLLIAPVAANISVSKNYSIDDSGTTPFNFWVGLIIAGGLLLIASLWHFPGGEEDFVSVLAWIPLGYAMYASFAVDSVTSSVGVGVIVAGVPQFTMIESHSVHSYWPVGIILFIVLCTAIFNTIRIVTKAKKEGELPRQVDE